MKYAKKLSSYEKRYGRVWVDIVNSTNDFIKDNQETIQDIPEAEKLADNLMLSGAWLYDRLNRKIGIPGRPLYRGSMSKKIRKAIGYTL